MNDSAMPCRATSAKQPGTPDLLDLKNGELLVAAEEAKFDVS